MNLTHSILVIVLASALSFSLNSQQASLGSWNILNLKYALSDNWSFFAEGQIRSLKFYDNFHYYEAKGGVNYELTMGFDLHLAPAPIKHTVKEVILCFQKTTMNSGFGRNFYSLKK
jgi:hypothetical protein